MDVILEFFEMSQILCFLFKITVFGDYIFCGGQCEKRLQGSFSYNLLFDALLFPMDNLKEF